MNKKMKDMLELQKAWYETPYVVQAEFRKLSKVYQVAYDMFDKEKASTGSLENKVFNYENRQAYIIAFCVQFKNLYNERKGYYDELIEYWEN